MLWPIGLIHRRNVWLCVGWEKAQGTKPHTQHARKVECKTSLSSCKRKRKGNRMASRGKRRVADEGSRRLAVQRESARVSRWRNTTQSEQLPLPLAVSSNLMPLSLA